jgi:hypothetical protein
VTQPNAAGEQTAARIATGYATQGPALEMGSVVHEGVPHPAADVRVPLSMLNRHGLVAGATGTGKTKTLQLMAEQLSAAGVPVVLADIKGDLSGLAQPGTVSERITTRAQQTGDAWAATGYPVEYLSLGGLGPGVPVRATMTGFGPVLLSKVLGLNPTQESSLGLIFHYADDAGLPLLDLKDLRSVVSWLVSDEGKPELKGLGGLSSATQPYRAGGARRGRLLRGAGVGARRHHADHPGRPWGDQCSRAGHRPGPAGALLHLPDVAAGRAVRGAAGGR